MFLILQKHYYFNHFLSFNFPKHWFISHFSFSFFKNTTFQEFPHFSCKKNFKKKKKKKSEQKTGYFSENFSIFPQILQFFWKFKVFFPKSPHFFRNLGYFSRNFPIVPEISPFFQKSRVFF